MKKIFSLTIIFKKYIPAIVIFFALIAVFVLSYGAYCYAYQDKVYYGISVGNINLSGQTKQETEKILADNVDKFQTADFTFNYQEKSWTIPETDIDIKYNTNATIDSVWQTGRNSNIWKNFQKRISLIFSPQKSYFSFSYNQAKLNSFFNKISAQIESKGNDAYLSIEDGTINIVEEKTGQELDNQWLNQQIINKIGWLDASRDINISLATYTPKITVQDIKIIQPNLEKIFSSNFFLKWDQGTIEVDLKTIGNWLETFSEYKDNKYQFSYLFSREKIENYVNSIANKINKNPVDAKLTITNGKASVFESSQDGYNLNQEQTITDIANLLSKRIELANTSEEIGSTNIQLAVKTQKPSISNDTINDLGIKELIGKGTTNFSGSPENRKYNIKLGTQFISGALIKPGEEFSFINALGTVSESRGFKKELVIKEDRTTPEVGGGLCQVSTTVFRAALNSGLPITERTNHRYRVSYYEPPVGMDATIYDPSPDLKFKNDTPGYILIQGKISGNILTFELYGTNDGRKVEIGDSRVYDITTPPEPVYIEDPNLAPGEIKVLEKAHNGASADFHYKVTNKDGKVTFEKTFYSKYVAWRAMYARGPGESSSSSSESTPTPTPAPESSPTPTPFPSPTQTSTSGV
ncbi:MAG: VanW family protein [Patescibacteria group bacterium]|nr:VanW family protein [Patescibacteria group bacterium]